LRARRWKEGKGGSVEVQCDDEERGTNNQRENQCPRRWCSQLEFVLQVYPHLVYFLHCYDFNNGVPLNNMKVEGMG
jgi:hypothetical protein